MQPSYFMTILTTGLLLTTTAYGAAKAQHKSTDLICEDRKINLQGECFQEDADTPRLVCTSLKFNFTDIKSNKILNSRDFKIKKGQTTIDGTPTEIFCTETPTKEKFVVVMMGTGGNCEQCEWMDVYSWNGVYIGSSADKDAKIKKIVSHAGDSAYNPKTKKIIAEASYSKFYTPSDDKTEKVETKPILAKSQSMKEFICPPIDTAGEKISDGVRAYVEVEVNSRFNDALGADANEIHRSEIVAKLAKTTIDPDVMAALVKASGCAALIDRRSSCSGYFDTEFGDPLSFFLRLPKKSPLRLQFEAGMKALPDKRQRADAAFCMGF